MRRFRWRRLLFGGSDYRLAVLQNPLVNLTIIGVLFAIFLSAGTWLFIRRERNR